MTSKDEIEYKTTVTDEHLRDEEFQWARILSQGNPAKGMVLLYLQKACAAFHEFEPAFKANVIKPEQVEFFRRRLAARVKHVIVTIQNNGLDNINGAIELNRILESIESAEQTSWPKSQKNFMPSITRSLIHWKGDRL